MSLFAALGMPCLTLFLLFFDRELVAEAGIAGRRESPALAFIKGFFYAVPCLVVMFLVRRYVPLSYRGFPLYGLFLITDHLIPMVFLGVLFFLAYSRSSYAPLLAFGGGFYTLVGIVEIVANFGEFEAYHLFLLPVIRMAVLLFFTLFFLRFGEWYGLVRVLYLVLLIAVPFLAGAITFLYMLSYVLWAGLLSLLFFLGSLAYTYIERKT
jgi:hypothetical protein